MPAPLVIFDISYLAHRAKWSTGEMSYNGQPTGTLWGVLLQVNRLRRLFPSNSSIVFAWDSIISLRRKIMPEYKASRKKEYTPEELKMKEEFHQQMNILQSHVLEPMGFYHHIKRRGYEADDGIASLVFWAAENPAVGGIWIVSSDDDLFQLLDYATLFRPHVSRNYSKEDLWNEWGLTPEEWIVATSISGTHNGVPGVKGVGIKTAAKYLQTKGAGVSSSCQIAINNAYNDGTVEINMELIRLPYRGMNLVPHGFVPGPYRLDLNGMEKVKSKFGFQSLREEEWS